MRGERAAFARLHGELKALADAIAQARDHLQGALTESDAAMGGKGVALAALLDEMEQRVDTMRELADRHVRAGAPDLVAAPPAEAVTAARAGSHGRTAGTAAADAPAHAAAARVPTVSDVVSRLGRSNEEALPAMDRDDITPPRSAQDVPTVSMLEAMVEALTASAPAAPADSHDVGDADGDPAAFLFDPEPERQSDPAQLSPKHEPVPAATDGTPPQSDAGAEKRQDKLQSEAAATAAPTDPLAPLKAMSEEEKIALFS